MNEQEKKETLERAVWLEERARELAEIMPTEDKTIQYILVQLMVINLKLKLL